MKLLNRFMGIHRSSDWPDFAGKILAVYCNSGAGGGMFQDARMVRIGFNEFVVGKRVVAEPLQECWSNVTVWIAIHDIAQMIVFDDVESAKLAFQSNETDDCDPGAR